MVKSPPTRPMIGGTNDGQRPIRFKYWRTGYGAAPARPVDFYVVQAGEYHCRPNYLFNAAHDTQTHFYYHLSGGALLEAAHFSKPLNGGDLFIVPPQQPYTYKGGQEARLHWFALEGSMPAVLGEPRLSHYALGGDPELEGLFVEIREILILRKPGYALRAIGVFYELLARLEELTAASNAPESAYPDTVRQAIIYLRETFHEPFDAGQTAAAAGVSPSHLRALFEKWVGESPKRYHTRYRIDLARRLLIEQRLPVFEAGFHVGFDDVHHFSRVFKQVTGVAPSHYLEQVQAPASNGDAAGAEASPDG